MTFNIRNKLILFAVLAIVVPLGLSALIILFQLSAATNQRSMERLQSDARVARSIFAKRQENLRSASQAIAQALVGRGLAGGGGAAPAPAPAGSQPAAGAPAGAAAKAPTDQPATGSKSLVDALENARKANQVTFTAYVDKSGKVIAQHNSGPVGDGMYFKDNPLFTDVNNAPQEGPRSGPRAEDAPVLEALGLKDAAAVKGVNQGLFLEAAAPVMVGDTMRGVVLVGQLINNDVSADASGKQSVVNEIKDTLYKDIPQDGAAIVALGNTIISTNLGGEQGGTASGQSVTGAAGSEADPSFNDQKFGNTDYKTSFVPVTEVSRATGTHEVGRIGVAIRQSWFSEIVSRVRWTILIVTLVALVLAVAAAIYAAQALTKPIVELTEAANRISLGELDVPINVSSQDEIGTLGESLDRMRISLKQAIERLRKR